MNRAGAALAAAGLAAATAVSAGVLGPAAADRADPSVGPRGADRVRVEAASVHWRTGRPANDTDVQRMSDDGRMVLMFSRAKSLIPKAPRDADHLYVRDRRARSTEVVTARSDGTPVPGNRWNGMAISGDGRFATFSWDAPELSPTRRHPDQYVYAKNLRTGQLDATRIRPSGITAGTPVLGVNVWATNRTGRYIAGDAAFDTEPFFTTAGYLLDRRTGRVRWVGPAGGRSRVEAISPDGRYVVYSHGEIGTYPQDYRYDRRTGRSRPLPDGPAGDSAYPWQVRFSGDGRFMVATWLDPDDVNPTLVYRSSDMTIVQRLDDMVADDISHTGRYLAVGANPDNHRWHQLYRYDRRTSQLIHLSINADGEPANTPTTASDISADGRTIAFNGGASNLVPGDQRGGGYDNTDNYDAFVSTIHPPRSPG